MPRRAVRVDDFPNRDVLDEISSGVLRAAVFKAAIELEVFTRIAEGKVTIIALARSAGLDERGARLLLNALCSMGLLVRQFNEYLLTPTAGAFLVKGKPTYAGDAWLGDLAWDARGETARTVRSGKPSLANPFSDALEPLRAERAASFLADWERQLEYANDVWSKIEIPREGKKGLRVLALGCESGLVAFALARQWSGVRVTVIDRAMVVSYARQLAEKMDVVAQITFQARDVLDLGDEPDSYDLVLLENVNQYLGHEENVALFRRAYDRLVPEGYLILRAPIADDDLRTEGVLLGVQALLHSAGGDAFTYADYRSMIEAAGFFQVELLKDDWGLVTARRLAAAPPKKEKWGMR